MKCPHCATGIFIDLHDTKNVKTIEMGNNQGFGIPYEWSLVYIQCPACYQFIVYIERRHAMGGPFNSRSQVFPQNNPRPNCPKEVPNDIAQEYTEACLILPISPTASAALSRRCLQHFLREVVKVKSGNLIDEIKEVINIGQLPSHISEDLDAVRQIGNFAAHPRKNEQTGTILPVEPGEAEWNLEVLEALFDFYCVQPAKARKRRDDLNQKLTEARQKKQNP